MIFEDQTAILTIVLQRKEPIHVTMQLERLIMFVPQILAVQVTFVQVDLQVIIEVVVEAVVQEVLQDVQIQEVTTNLAS